MQTHCRRLNRHTPSSIPNSSVLEIITVVEKMLSTNKDRVNQVYECVKQFHTLEELPFDIPSPQSPYLLPTLRPYQVKAVKWMLYKEMHESYYQKSQGSSSTSGNLNLS